MQYFTSDIHFNDEASLRNDNRPFKNINKYDKYILKTWNKQVKKNDVIYVIGDFIDCDGEGYDGWKKSIHYVKRVRCDVVLVTGNNEDRVIKYYFDGDFEKFREYCINVGFKDVVRNMVVKVNDIDFYLVHKPKDCRMDILNLYGHIHRSGGIYKPYGFNVGCDLNHFRLYSEEDIKFLMGMKEKYWDKDKILNSDK